MRRARGPVPASDASCCSRSSRRSTAWSPTSPRSRPVTWCCCRRPVAPTPWWRPGSRTTGPPGSAVPGRCRTTRSDGRHDLHPDLSLLLSTSGSTGSPKLVRLSADAVRANALDIAAALGLDASDRAVSTLPLHYCYGLSVLHSHLAVGGSVLLTDASVTDPALWSAVQRGRGDLAGRGAAHLRAAGVERRAHRQRADAAPGHPGRRPARPGAGAGLGGAWSPRGLGPARHVRPDRGHRADGGHRAGHGGAGPGIRGSCGRGGPVQRARRRGRRRPWAWWATCTTPARTSCSVTRRSPTTWGAPATSPTSRPATSPGCAPTGRWRSSDGAHRS